MFAKICAISDTTMHSRRALALGTTLTEALGAELTAAEVEGTRSRRVRAIADHVAEADCDLVMVGAYAPDEEPDELGTVGPTCERLVRRCRTDALVIKDPAAADDNAPGHILCCIDGSPQAYAGLMSAFELAKKLGKSVECVGVYDPYLHYTLFNGIVNVLTKEAEAVFKFKDQEKLHEEIIDTGLAKIYQAHLEVARTLAVENDVPIKVTLLDGKAFEKILKLVRKSRPWLLVMGRIGVHSDDSMDIGATSENLLRLAPCNVLVTSSKYVPRVDIQAEESVEWTMEAKKIMERVPSWVRGVATTSILRWAIERGHSVITGKVINSAMGDLLPPGAAQAMGYVAEEVAIQHDNLEVGNTYLCRHCGYAAKDFRPVTCGVCKASGDEFEEINRDALQNLSKLKEGALEVEDTFDGKALTWTAEAKEVLRRVPSGYQRRRSKARIEKTARVRGLTGVSRDFAIDIVQQDLAETSYLTSRGEALQIMVKQEEKPDDTIPTARQESPLPWTDAAWARISRVPIGFMRDMTREKVEQFAAGKHMDFVDIAVCEEGIAEGRRMMAEALGNYKSGGAAKAEIRQAATAAAAPAPEWTDAAKQAVAAAADRTAAAGKLERERAEALGVGAAEERARGKKIEEIGQAFMARLGKQLGYGHPLSELTPQHQFTWTAEALERLERVPDFCREMTRWRVEWTAVKLELGRVITPAIMDRKFEMWGEVSEQIMSGGESKLEWAAGTMARLERIPDFVRGQVIQSVEGNARQWGVNQVDDSVLDKVIQKWIDTGDFHEGKFGYKAKPAHD